MTGDYLLAGKTTFLLLASSPPKPTLSSADADMPILGYFLVTSGNTPLSFHSDQEADRCEGGFHAIKRKDEQLKKSRNLPQKRVLLH